MSGPRQPFVYWHWFALVWFGLSSCLSASATPRVDIAIMDIATMQTVAIILDDLLGLRRLQWKYIFPVSADEVSSLRSDSWIIFHFSRGRWLFFMYFIHYLIYFLSLVRVHLGVRTVVVR